MIVLPVTAGAYDIVDLPRSMTFSDAASIFEPSAITSATVSDVDEGKHIDLTRDEINDFFYSASEVTVYRKINPTPFRGVAVNLYTAGGCMTFWLDSGLQIGVYGSNNFICYMMSDEDLNKFMYLDSLYRDEVAKQDGAEVNVNSASDFLRLPTDLWAQDGIKEAAARSLLPYDLSANYGDNISREQFCILIANFITVKGGYPSFSSYMAKNYGDYAKDNFADCEGRDTSIDALFAMGIVKGAGNEYFNPDGAITRQEAAKMLTETAAKFIFIGGNYKLSYADANTIAPWAEFYVKWVTEQGIMGGVDSAHFEPESFYSIQQAITTVSRLYNVVTK